MTRGTRVAAPVLAVVIGACGTPTPPIAAPAGPALPPGAERAYTALAGRFDRDAAMRVVELMQRYWRVAGNPGYNESIDHIRERLDSAGLKTTVEEYKSATPGWDYVRGSVWLDGADEPVLSKERDRVSLAINSFPTTGGRLTAPLVDVGRGTPKDYEGKQVKGAVVLGDASLGLLWREAVRSRGAAGVISTEIASYIRPSDPAAMTAEQREVFQWGGVPYDDKLKAFGFKASWRAADTLRKAFAKAAKTSVHVEIESAFHPGPARSLVAEIRGRTKPDDRIVLVAHVQEPGANDNASGCATLYGLARGIAEAIARGALPPPDRTLTFLWLDEIRGTRQWISAHPDDAKRVQYMFSMDMTGEDTAKTGGTFLIEKQADPSAVWPRPSDPHTEWGASEVKAGALKGSLLNDLHIAVARRRARDTGWVVRTNPYEGGSDHTVFASSGVPSLLDWHFTDRYYHTNQDTIDKVSAREMEHVGISVAASAYFLASASPADALAVVDLVSEAASVRLRLERQQGPLLVNAARDKAAAEQLETQVRNAWIKWYGEALDSIATLPSSGATAELAARIAAARTKLQ